LSDTDWKIVEDFYRDNYARGPRYAQIQKIISNSKTVDSLTEKVEYYFLSYHDDPLLTIKFMEQ
jgi:hypothetical protein